MRRAASFAAILAATLLVGAAPIEAQNITQPVTTNLAGRSYEPAYFRFTAQGSEAILNLSRVNARCASTTSCTSAADCSAFPGATCSGSPLRCQVPVDALVGQVAVVEAARLCELAACAGVSLGSVCSGGEVCPAGQTYCSAQGSCHTCPAAVALCMCDGQTLCDEPDAALGTAGVSLADGFDNGANPNLWLLDTVHIDNTTLDSRLVLGPGAALPEGASVAVAGTTFRLSAGTDYILFLKHAVNPRQTWAECFPAASLSVFLTSRAPRWCDLDDDGYSGTDCDPANGQAWAVPGEPGTALFSKAGGATDLSWGAPSSPGGTSAGTTYRVYGGSRTDLPALLNGSADSCLVTATSSLSATISGNPAPGALAWYLVRASNSCAEGTAGSARSAPRIHDPASCDDGVACTLDGCDASVGCVHAPSDAACDDSNACTADACSAVSGCSHTDISASCDDGNVCTDDSCTPAAGCVHVNNTAPCDDGIACTTADTCSGGVCGAPLASHLVISQLQTNGDPPMADDDEFVELYNPTAAPIGLGGLSIQYKAASGTTYLVAALAAQTIPSHGWFLLARSAYNGVVPADQIYTSFLMSGSGGHIFLVNGTSALSGPCSVSASIIDKVGWGTGNCPEGGVATAPAANNSILRRPGGSCGNGRDSNHNAVDFQSQNPSTPRNRFSAPQP